MPIPFIIAGLGVAAAITGVGGHLDAKDKREEAKELIEEFNKECNDTKKMYEFYKERYMNSLEKLGETKKEILGTSLKEFFKSYKKIKKKIKIEEINGMEEIATLSETDFRELDEMYCCLDGNLGMITGSALAYLALGEIFSTGGIEMLATGGLSTVLTTTAMLSPLSFLVGPAVMFTGGLYASIKADENLEETKKKISEKRVNLENMKVCQVKYKAIDEHAEMLDALLKKLNGYLCQLLEPLSEIALKVERKEDKIQLKDYLPKEDKKILSEASSIAKAIMAIIRTPMIDKEGYITYASKENLNKYGDVTGNF